MRTLKKNQAGFGIMELILVVALIVVIGVIGWFIYSTNQTNKKDTNNDSSHISSAGVNPSASWTTQCIANEGLCIKHPADWTVDQVNNSEFILDSPDTTALVQAQIINNWTGNNEKFYVTSQSYTYSGTSYKVFGGYTTGQTSNATFYAVVLSGFGDPNAMKVGATSSILTTQFVDYVHGSKGVLATIKLEPTAYGLVNNATPQAANAWLSSATTQTGVEILKTVTLN